MVRSAASKPTVHSSPDDKKKIIPLNSDYKIVVDTIEAKYVPKLTKEEQEMLAAPDLQDSQLKKEPSKSEPTAQAQ